MRGRYRWEFALIGICAIWGGTFVLVQDAVERVPPFLYLALRFAVAALALAALRVHRGLTRAEARAGVLMGLALFAGYAFQTVGLQYTSASNAGFLTGMFVVFTPVIGALVYRTLPARPVLAGVILATGGLVLLAMPSGFRIGRGDSLEVLTAVAFAVHILVIGHLGPGKSAARLTFVQVCTAAVLASAWSIGAERTVPPWTDATVWFAVLLTGVFATSVAFFVQTRAQQQIPPTRTAVILAAEPLFAGIFGYVVAGDRIGARGLAGGALIIAGIIVAELRARSGGKV